jgi:hypothetical protein
MPSSSRREPPRQGGHLVARSAIEDGDFRDARLAQSHASGIHGGVAAPDDAHLALGQGFSAQVVGLEESHARDHASDVLAVDAEALALVGADGNVDSVEPAGHETVDGHVLAEGDVALELDVGIEERGDFLADHIAWQVGRRECR